MRPRILYISNEDRSLGGSSLSLKAMLDALGEDVEPVILFREDGPACNFFRQNGYNCMVVPFNRGTFNHHGLSMALRFLPHLFADAILRRRCIKKVIDEIGRPALVHSNSGTVDIGLDIARKAKVPHVWHIREYLDLGLHQRPFPSWKSWKRKLKLSDTVIAISPGLLKHLGTGSNGICLPDAVLSAKDAVLKEKKEPYILFLAGNISELKRPEEALQIFAGAGLPGYTLKFAGGIETAMKDKLEALADNLGVGKRIEFVPFVSDVRGILSYASALLVCTEYEGMGRVAIEAMFCGCPVIARGSGGSADVLEGGLLGRLYTNAGKASLMLEEVCNTLPENQLRSAQSEAVRKYSIENYGKKILEIYNELI